MNFKANESSQKLNGSYYTPKWLSAFIMRWVMAYKPKSILEPSCGDGVFFSSDLLSADCQSSVLAFDIDQKAVADAQDLLRRKEIDGEARCQDFLAWALSNLAEEQPRTFDTVVGNPPFIRYQYLSKTMQDEAQKLFAVLNIKFTKHTNAWVPFLLASIEFLNPGGKIGMVIPSEILHVLYASELRKYLLNKCSRIKLIDPEDIWFDGTLQGAMLLLAEKRDPEKVDEVRGVCLHRTKGMDFAQEDPVHIFEESEYASGDFLKNKWTYALLSNKEREALFSVAGGPYVSSLIDLADVDVGIVTGANGFFLVNDETVEKYGLHDVAYPMFGRSEHCAGIIYDKDQHDENARKGYPTNFLWFTEESQAEKHRDYLDVGLSESLNTRYKCSIRNPWYRVPSVYASPVSMLKRSNGMPRLILNEQGAFTTDTAYRVRHKKDTNVTNLVGCFPNSLTALFAELEGRHYGGGVLELVPSEIERLMLPYDALWEIDLKKIDQLVRKESIDNVLSSQDELIFKKAGFDWDRIVTIQNALHVVKARRQRIEL